MAERPRRTAKAPRKATRGPAEAAPEEPGRVVKIVLHNRGEDVETPWAIDLGPAPGKPWARRVRLDNVPFLHAKPTLGDEIIVEPDESYDGRLTWDAGGVSWDKIGTRIHHDGGRYAMVIDYRVETDDVDAVWRALGQGLSTHDIQAEGCYGPSDDKPGMAYLAVPSAIQPAEVMKRIRALKLPVVVKKVHP